MKQENRILAVIDTNVLVSTLYSRTGTSNPGIIFNQVLEGNIIPLINDDILKEYRNVLTRPYFNFPLEIVTALYDAIVETGIMVNKEDAMDEWFPDKDDRVFYEVKMAVDDSYLITGNIKHFPKKAFVVTPAQMVNILREKGIID